MTTYYLVIYNPHLDETRVETWAIRGVVGSYERTNDCCRFERHKEALKGQDCEIGQWTAEDWHYRNYKVFATNGELKRRYGRRKHLSAYPTVG